jgi:hypothetical protein
VLSAAITLCTMSPCSAPSMLVASLRPLRGLRALTALARGALWRLSDGLDFTHLSENFTALSSRRLLRPPGLPAVTETSA